MMKLMIADVDVDVDVDVDIGDSLFVCEVMMGPGPGPGTFLLFCPFLLGSHNNHDPGEKKSMCRWMCMVTMGGGV
ncbi:predicted protein [Sclerotinia sclerotiorum 1980 UF-70]|uniref:Uncharacterized protein n=1 Tax=Sclerotinia sclerotiorum (strain ATCC 18683 / 1980 / Ss-1) TaxID=665079 RepID=A7EEZ1_SCLS1|nr:predicted protein [Sclerotinia sclerotiorum 1980 UF-70]EDO01407.1 predicted protein [Sclerotinia sclerotiorum 1980 UF-70]